MANKKKSKSRESYAAAYKSSGREATNRKKRLLRTLKQQPNNEQVIQALKDTATVHRVAPKVPHWSASKIATAKIVKEFCGRVDKDYFSPDPKKQAEALRMPGPVALAPVSRKHKRDPLFKFGPFSIAMRIVAKGGTPWLV